MAIRKSMIVLGLTFGNTILYFRSEVWSYPPVKQRWAGKLALGVHRKIPDKAVQGDMGWPSFKEEEQ